MDNETLLDEGNPTELPEVGNNLEEPEEEVGESSQGLGEERKEGEPFYYTVDEMRALSPDEINTSRIAPEYQSFYKAMQASYTKKYQELADLRKSLEAEKEALKSKEPKSLEEAFMTNPVETVGRINAYIDELESSAVKADDIGEIEKAQAYRQQARKIDQYKEELILKRQQLLENKLQQDTAISNTYQQVFKVIPDFEKKAPYLEKFAKDTFGFTSEELQLLTDPTNPMAVKTVIGINRLYDQLNPTEKLKDNEVKTPMKVLSPGSGERTSLTKETLLKRARQGGTVEDFAEYLANKRAVGGE